MSSLTDLEAHLDVPCANTSETPSVPTQTVRQVRLAGLPCSTPSLGTGGLRSRSERALNVASVRGSDDQGNGVSVQARSYVQLIMGAVSLWTRPPALYLCTRPKKIPNSAHELPATSFSTGATVEAQLSSLRRHLWNSPHLHSRDVDHRVHRQMRISMVNEIMGISLCVATGAWCHGSSFQCLSGRRQFTNLHQ